MSEQRTETTDWMPPFVAKDDADIDCPVCKAQWSVRVREKATYFDGDTVEAYCAECHAELEVHASVEITFGDCEPTEKRSTTDG
jgi:hypothetical protein